MVEYTELQVIYLGQVTRVIESLNVALQEAIFLKAKSHENTSEKKEAAALVEDLGRWLNYAERYREYMREDPSKMFAG